MAGGRVERDVQSPAPAYGRGSFPRLALYLAVAALVIGTPGGPAGARFLTAGIYLVAALTGLLLPGTLWLGSLLLDLLAHASVVSRTGGRGGPFFLLLAVPVLVWGVRKGVRGGIYASVAAVALSLTAAPATQLTLPGLERDLWFRSLHGLAFLLLGFFAGVLGRRLEDEARAHRETRRELEETKLDAESIVASLSTGLLCIDPLGCIRRVNRRAAELILGRGEFEPEAALSDWGADRARDPLRLHLDRCLAAELDSVFDLEPEDAPLGRPLEIATVALRGGAGEFRGLVVLLADLTERRNREEERKRSEKLALIGRLSAGLAHEIRNSLKPITGSVELLRDELDEGSLDPADDRARRAREGLMEIILREADSLEAFLTEFLAFARDKSLTLETVALERVLEEEALGLAAGLEVPLRRAGASAPGSCVRVDRGAFRQVLRNLVLNAVESGERDSVELGSAAAGDRVHVWVRDRGSGIPPEAKGRLYEPFFTTKPQGTGLGLAIARDLVERLGGTLDVAPAEGGGTRALVSLPRVALDVSQDVAAGEGKAA